MHSRKRKRGDVKPTTRLQDPFVDRIHRLLAKSPATFVLTLIVTITTNMLRSVDPHFADELLRQQSTNLVQMSRDAPRVLILSAFFVQDRGISLKYLLFVVLLVAVERWMGSLRWLVVAAVSHIGASLLTTMMIWLQVRDGTSTPDVVYPIDVGVSYIVAGMAGAVLWRFGSRIRLVIGTAVLVWLAVPVLHNDSFTNIGHLLAFALGMATGFGLRPSERLDVPANRNAHHRLLAAGILAGLVAGGLGVVVLDPPTIHQAPTTALARAVVTALGTDSTADVTFIAQRKRVDTTIDVPSNVRLRPGDHRVVSYEKDTPTIAVLGINEVPAVSGESFFAFASILTATASLALLAMAYQRFRQLPHPTVTTSSSEADLLHRPYT